LNRDKVRHFFRTRFVVMSEILGYAMSGAIFIGVLASLFIQVDTVAKTGGRIHPSYREVVADSDALVIEYLARSGENVVSGQPIVRVALDKATQNLILARRHLSSTAELLGPNSDNASLAALHGVRTALEALPPPDGGRILSAAHDGVVQHVIDPNDMDIIPKGTPLAILFNHSVLALEAVLGNSNADSQVVEGQMVRVTIPEVRDTLAGHVTGVQTEDGITRVSVEFEDVSLHVQEHFRALLPDDEQVPSQQVEANIVVGHESLFKQMFGRK